MNTKATWTLTPMLLALVACCELPPMNLLSVESPDGRVEARLVRRSFTGALGTAARKCLPIADGGSASQLPMASQVTARGSVTQPLNDMGPVAIIC